MIRGTTPTHTFTLPFDTSLIKRVKITYAQDDKKFFCKETDDCVLSGNIVTTKLTQEETFLLDCKKLVQIQIRVVTTAGEVLATDEMVVTVNKCLDDEVMS